MLKDFAAGMFPAFSMIAVFAAIAGEEPWMISGLVGAAAISLVTLVSGDPR